MMIKWISETLKWCEKTDDKPRLYPKKETSKITIFNLLLTEKHQLILLIITAAIILSLLIGAYHAGFSCTETGMLRNYIITGA